MNDVPPIEQKEFIDLDEAQVLKEPRRPTDKIMTHKEANLYRTGEFDPPQVQAAPQAPLPATPAPVPAPAQQPAPAQPQAAPQQPQQAIVSNAPEQPPIQQGDSRRVRDRINQLFGQRRRAEEHADALTERMRVLEAENQAFRAGWRPPSAPSAPAPGGYEYVPAQQPTFDAGYGQQPEPAGDYVSRTELKQMFTAMAQANRSQERLREQQRASRSEAELEFPDVFQDPELRQAVDDILVHDESLSNDPSGPMKAALMARGLNGHTPVSEAAPGQAAAEAARKLALTGVGPSIPEGSQSPDVRAQEYHDALNTARASGRDSDYVRALLLKRQA